jgi:hypothetical protein
MFIVTGIYIYPIKGLPGLSLSKTCVEQRGLQFDRRWMLVDENNVFLSQRTFPILSQFKLAQNSLGFTIESPFSKDSIHIPYMAEGNEIVVEVWSDKVNAINFNIVINDWFSAILQTKCKLVYLSNSSIRELDEKFNRGADMVSFADGFPILLVGESSLEALNNRLLDPIKMDRFRPNLVFKGGLAFEEDMFGEFNIGSNEFLACKACARCSVTTVNQQSGELSKEPLKTLATFRMNDQKIYFGENVMSLNFGGTIYLGDAIQTNTKKEGKQFRIQNS